jgi:hypothetical protein
MNKYIKLIITIIIFSQLVTKVNADVLCQNKKSGAIKARATACTRKEKVVTNIVSENTSTSASATENIANSLTVQDTGAVSSGSDSNMGLELNVTRLGAVGGSVSNIGTGITVVGDTGGDSTNIGLYVSTSGADNNYCALFLDGNVGIGVSDPDELLEIAGRIHLGQTTAPSTTSDKLYNVNGNLFWNGNQLATTATAGGGDITSVSAGTGLSGGGSSGSVTLSVDSGTTANKILRLNSSAELPSVSGVNLTALNATSLSTGTVSDARLSSNVSLLGNSIGLASEVTGILPISNGGTGANSLNNLLTLSTHTTGNYVASLATNNGISGGAAGSEGATLSLSLDQSFAATWTALHSFSTGINVGTTAASVEALHLDGRLHMEPASAPVVTTNKLYNVGGELFFSGQNISSTAAGGDITGVTAGTGLLGGGTTGAVTLNIDTGVTANKIVQLDGSARLPEVSGLNLTNLNASNIASGTLADARLSANVSLLGSTIGLTSEVAGILPVANGGTGSSSLTNLIQLTSHTVGNYVGEISAGSGISLSSTGAEGGTASLSLNQAFTPTWTGQHTFSGIVNDITTGANENLALMPNGTGAVGIGTASPSAKLDTVIGITSNTASTDIGAEFNITDTGVVAAGTDTTIGADINVIRTGATNGTIDTIGLDIDVNADSGGLSKAIGLNLDVSGADTNYAAIFNGGFVGIGTNTPSAALDTLLSSTATSAANEIGANITLSDSGIVNSGNDNTTALMIDLDRTNATGGNIHSKGIDISVTGDAGGASLIKGLEVEVSGADTNIAAQFSGGSVGIGTLDTTVLASANVPAGSLVVNNGIVCVDDGGDNCDDLDRAEGTLFAEDAVVTGIDLAEEFPINTDDSVEAGDIVIIDTKEGDKCVEFGTAENGSKTCRKFNKGLVPFITRATNIEASIKKIIGVISSDPGLTLGGFGQHELIKYKKAPVALAGRIPVKVSNENGAIEVGDRITVGSTSGVGAKALNQEGVIGIALEPYDDNAIGNILVLTK